MSRRAQVIFNPIPPVTNVTEQNAANRFEGTKAFGDTTETIPVTVDNTGSNRALFVSTGADGSPTSITYDGVGLTQVIGSNIAVGNATTSLWYLLNPATGTNDLVVNGSSSVDTTFGGTAYVNATTPTGLQTDTGNPSTSNSISDTVATTDVFIGCCCVDDPFGITPDGGQTIIWQREEFNIDAHLGFKQGTGGSTTISNTFNNEDNVLAGVTIPKTL